MAGTTATRLPPGKRTREALRIAHLWIGVGLCIPFVLLGISGSYLVYHDTFDALLTDEPERILAEGAMRPAVEIVAAAAAARPELAPLMLAMPEAAGEPATVRVGPEGASFRDPRVVQLLVDPVSLEVLGEAGGRAGGLTRWMHDMHGHLLLPDGGRQAVGWIGIAMLALGFSGLVIWWPRPGKLRAALTVGRGARGYRLHRELHGAVGFWSLPVFIVVSFTGVFIVFPQTIMSGVRPLLGGEAEQAAPPAAAEEGAVLSLAEIVAIAVAAGGDGELRMVALSFGPGRPAQGRFRVPGYDDGAPPLVVQVDPRSGAVLEVEDPREASADATFAAWQRPLHQGLGWGPLWRALVFVSGFLPLLFAITGITMWLRRRRAQASSRRLRARGRQAAE